MDDTLRQLPFHYCDIPSTSRRRPKVDSSLADAYAEARASATALDERIRNLIVKHFGDLHDPGNSLRELPYYSISIADDDESAARQRSADVIDAHERDGSSDTSALAIAGGDVDAALLDQPHRLLEWRSPVGIESHAQISEEPGETDSIHSQLRGVEATSGGTTAEEVEK
ncbi:uncharacterized protein SCHCODRAFT_02113586 [Schizophyllum commune H4-8]|uniref:uncharacterized protein n=1 Tax=Schizophyllum commune (strain H4-8 / FGSC 9210) TaxID=578458 RepID=UPI00215DE249|nr:uncharacterized protein SCHCODRAFT_02113586 [Schizophyllum commune H4-8]KAI5886129.1 hypothetical protein SCHCODRAFT_02113586 [Schizophyllum commune H4-8]